MAQQPLVSHPLHIIEVSRSHSDISSAVCLVTIRHTTLGRNPLEEWSARRRDLYLATHNTHKRPTSMLPVGFEPVIPASQRPLVSAAINCGKQTVARYIGVLLCMRLITSTCSLFSMRVLISVRTHQQSRVESNPVESDSRVKGCSHGPSRVHSSLRESQWVFSTLWTVHK